MDVHVQLEGIRGRLSKKKEFESACRDLAALFSYEQYPQDGHAQAALHSVVCRARTLLQTRYTGRGFWLAGQGLFEAAQSRARGGEGPDAAARARDVEEALARAREELGDGDGGGEDGGGAAAAAMPPRGFFFEGQLSGDEPPARAPAGASLIEEMMMGLIAQQSAAVGGAAAEGGQSGERGGEEGRGQDEDEAEAEAGAGAEVEAEAEAGGEPRSIIDQMEEQLSQWAGQGHHEVIPGLEEIINQTIEEAAGQANHGPPPASKAAVQALRRVEVTQERLDEVGAGTECAVCREELKLGEEVQQMPCNKTHVFHPDCLKPWLDAHNSCPVCRFELPTDDHDYERAKEVAKERAEERQGVENALPGAEFMYI